MILKSILSLDFTALFVVYFTASKLFKYIRRVLPNLKFENTYLFYLESIILLAINHWVPELEI
jgi:hypothetical protein